MQKGFREDSRLVDRKLIGEKGYGKPPDEARNEKARSADEKQHFIQKLSHSRRVVSAKERWGVGAAITLRRQDTKNKVSDFLSHQAQLDKTFATENAADDFALQEAMKWIDKNSKLKS